MSKNNTELQALKAQLEAMKQENAKLKKSRATATLTFKVSAKGAVSVYGMGRFPVTLYREQWEKLISVMPQLKQFIADNADSLTSKTDKTDSSQQAS